MTAVLCCSLSSRAPLLAAWLDSTAGDSTTGSLLESPASTATLRGGVSLPFLQSVRHCVACCMRLRALPRCPSSLLECACLVLPHCCARCQLVVCLFCSPCNWVCGVCLSRSSFYARVLRTAMRCPSFASFPLLRTHLSGALALPAMRANANSAGQSGSGNDAAEGGYAHYGATVAWRRLPHRGVVPLVAWDTSFSCDSRVVHLT